MTQTEVRDDKPLSQPGHSPTQRGRAASAGFMQRLARFRHNGAFEITAIFIVLQAVLITWSLAAPEQFRYLSPANVNVLLQSIPVLAILALGVGVLMISGEFDLSVGANYVFSSIVMATQINNGMSPLLAVVIGVGVGAFIGLVNGIITVRFGIPSFITTLGTMSFWAGAVFFYSGTGSVTFDAGEGLKAAVASGLDGIPSQALWLVAFGIGFWALLHRHRLGNHIYAVGGNKTAAAAIGIRPARIKIITFTIAGVCAALAGILAAVRVESIQPGSVTLLPLQTIAACVVGGIALYGGRGSVVGMVLGAALIYTIQDILFLLAAPGFYVDVFVGLLIVAAAILNQFFSRRTN